MLNRSLNKYHTNNNSQQVFNIMKDIIGEFEAIIQYGEHIASPSSDAITKAILQDIQNEEKVHVGELLTNLIRIDPSFAEYLDKGEMEAKEIINNITGVEQ